MTVLPKAFSLAVVLYKSDAHMGQAYFDLFWKYYTKRHISKTNYPTATNTWREFGNLREGNPFSASKTVLSHTNPKSVAPKTGLEILKEQR